MLQEIDVTTVEDIPQGHKFVIKAIKNGDPVIKYGFRIGFAQADIPVGAWVHTHNLKTGLGELLEYTYDQRDIRMLSLLSQLISMDI